MPLATPTRRMPMPEDVRTFFDDLLGKQTVVDQRAEIDLGDEDDETVWLAGVFIENDGSVGGACVTNLELAAFAGAALAMIPKPVAEESIKAGELEEGLRENFHEVANIATALLNGPSVPHLKIRDFVAGVPDEVRDLVVRAAGRRTYNVLIPDYGEGVFAFYAS